MPGGYFKLWSKMAPLRKRLLSRDLKDKTGPGSGVFGGQEQHALRAEGGSTDSSLFPTHNFSPETSCDVSL